MLKMHETKRRFRDVPDSTGAECDVLQGAPALGQEGEASLPEGSYCAEECIVRLGVDIKITPVSRLLHRGEDAVTCAFVAGVGQDRHLLGVGADAGPRRCSGLR